ncbi:hypothetical protein LN042_11640 [Kitasatospora sp. RB6PN24]|uniref:hypothetical protein n=1 Tax=Kitasatospora humi TaxID=2893891 RepID=UPI001E65BC59|nr:hypothetical protein [Kitasatospora humi]MCC9307742.1 hypothetical protein [Kitasatospora humi]
MDHTTLLVTLISLTVWALLFLAMASDLPARVRRRRARAARRRVRPLRYVPTQRSAR